MYFVEKVKARRTTFRRHETDSAKRILFPFLRISSYTLILIEYVFLTQNQMASLYSSLRKNIVKNDFKSQ